MPNFKHGHARRGKVSPTYISWTTMMRRCNDPSHNNYRWYGAVGVKVCLEWFDFNLFLRDVGERPQGATLDRINPHGNYEPGNVRWATSVEQRNNHRQPFFKSVCKYGHPLDGDNLYIRPDTGVRQCRACRDRRRRESIERAKLINV